MATDRRLTDGPAILIPNNELFPERDLAIAHLSRALGAAAVAASVRISEFTGGVPEKTDLEPAEKKRREKIIDTEADAAFKSILRNSPILFHGVDAEGGKEARPDKLGEAMPLAIGHFGRGDKKASYTIDVVEGTGFATHNWPNAMSIAGLSTYGGITEIPPVNGVKPDYARKLFTHALFKNDVSLDQPPAENIRAIMLRADVPADRITVAVMDRKCNTAIIAAADEMGVKLVKIDRGDLIWDLIAMTSDPIKNPIVIMGRGGAEEGSIAMVGARALDATGQISLLDEEAKDIDIEIVDGSGIWTPDKFVPGMREHSSVVLQAITQNTHLGLDAVKPFNRLPNHFVVSGWVFSSVGNYSIEDIIPIPQLAA